MDQISLFKEAQKRINSRNEGAKKEYKCPICKDTGFLALNADAEYVPIIDLLGSQALSVKNCRCKNEQYIETSMKHSGIDLQEYKKKNFDTFRLDTPENTKMYNLAREFVNHYDTAQGCGFFGHSGTGKTHICIAICNELAQQGISHRYFSYRTEIHKLKALTYDHEAYNKRFSEFVNANLLYIDDLFKLARTNSGEFDMHEIRIMYDIINTRYINNKKILVSSEYTVSQIKDIDEATGSRLFEMLSDFGMKVDGKNRRFMNIGGER